MSNEIDVQEIIIKKLAKLELYPFSVTYTLEFGGVASITFFDVNTLDEFLELIDYKSMCDKKNYIVFHDNNTILIKGFEIRKLYEL